MGVVRSSVQSLGMVSDSPSLPEGHLPPRSAKCASGLTVQKQDGVSSGPSVGSERVEFSHSCCSGGVPQAGGTASRFVCEQVKRPDEGVLLTDERGGGVGSRCHVNQLAGISGICLPSLSTDPQSIREGQSGESGAHFGSPKVARQAVVFHSASSNTRPSGSVTSASRPIVAARGAASKSGILQPYVLEDFRRSLSRQGFPAEALDTAAASLSTGSQQTYYAQWSAFSDWMRARGADPLTASVSSVLSFLQDRLDSGLQYSTIKSYVSSLGHFLPFYDGVSIGKVRAVVTLLKGVKRLRPPQRIIVPQWDLDLVLEYLNKAPFEPLESASFKHCLLKTVFLVAVASAARASELAALDCRAPFTVVKTGYASLCHNEVFVPKVASPQNVNRNIYLESLFPSRSCPVRALSQYVNLSSRFRVKGCTQLFVSFALGGRKGRGVVPSTISGWLVSVIKEAYLVAGLPAPSVTGHTTRKMGTSRAWLKGASVEAICRAATWSSHTTFAKHYKLDVLPSAAHSISRLVLSAETQPTSSSEDET